MKIALPISIPDQRWWVTSGELPPYQEGATPPDFSYSFFPGKKEAAALQKADADQMAWIIGNQNDLTSRFLHQLIVIGREDIAIDTVELLGGPEVAQYFAQNDWHWIIMAMQQSFVPGEEIQRVVERFQAIGLTMLTDTRRRFHRHDNEIQGVLAARPTAGEIQRYIARVNSSRHQEIPDYTRDVRILDPSRNYRYAGLARRGDYDWVEVTTDEGYHESAHIQYGDTDTMIGLLNVY